MSVQRVDGDQIEMSIKDFFGANLKRGKPKSSNKLGVCLGLELHTYSEKNANRLKHRVMFLSHPSEAICSKWLDEINRILKSRSTMFNKASQLFYDAVGGQFVLAEKFNILHYY